VKEADRRALEAVRAAALPLDGPRGDWSPLLVGDARLRAARRGVARHARVLPRARRDHEAAHRGEGLHGRRGRGRLARRLPRQPLRARRVGTTDARAKRSAASSASRTWMWRNTDVLEFVEWLRAHNDALPPGARRSASTARPLQPLPRSRPCSATSTRLTRRPRAAPAALLVLRALRRGHAGLRLRGRLRPAESCERGGRTAGRAAPPRRRATRATGASREDEFFFAEQNARLVKNAEEYYRSMFRGRVSSWNLRDRHMAETLDALVAHLDAEGAAARRSSSGRTTRTSATRAPPRWARAASGTSASSCASATARETCSSASRRTPARSRPRRLGRARRAQARAPGAAGQLRGALPRRRRPALPARPARDGGPARGCASRGWSAPSASSTAPRPSARATTSTRACRQFDAVLHFDETRAVEPLERGRAGHAAHRPADARRGGGGRAHRPSALRHRPAGRAAGRRHRLGSSGTRPRARLPSGYFGASTGGGAALVAAADRPDAVHAVVSRGGRPDLAGEVALPGSAPPRYSSWAARRAGHRPEPPGDGAHVGEVSPGDRPRGHAPVRGARRAGGGGPAGGREWFARHLARKSS
jgi:hypothetical protein